MLPTDTPVRGRRKTVFVHKVGGLVHVLNKAGDRTECYQPVHNDRTTKGARKTGRCAVCDRALSLRNLLEDAWLDPRPINKMAVIRELVDLRARQSAIVASRQTDIEAKCSVADDLDDDAEETKENR